ncbi:MAG: hypothetical protein GTN78_07020 [Gemmatimonadales bacterium]|nr:hypothetical protein [Gemmatimonadales bacterium]NIQ99941.1 hypothetical protein [Gemmatimonadales bacterium]NIS64400.1 hypothetical protein [Gemmatimonadales bacterium]
MRIVLAIGATLLITYVVAFVVYGAVAALTGLEPPQDGSPVQFLLSVLVVKLGLAVGFVLLFAVAREIWRDRWLVYALIWWVLFVVSEIGQAIAPDYSWLEAGAGIVAEAVYCPLAAWVTAKLLTPRRGEHVAT